MNQINEEMQQLIGMRVAMNTKERSFSIGGMKRNMTSYSLDENDPLVAKMRNMAERVRLITPGTVCTQDIRGDRLNFHIDQYGTIQRVYYG